MFKTIKPRERSGEKEGGSKVTKLVLNWNVWKIRADAPRRTKQQEEQRAGRKTPSQDTGLKRWGIMKTGKKTSFERFVRIKKKQKINQFVPFVPWKQMITKKKLKTGKKATIWGRKWLDRSKIVCSRSSCVYKNVFSFYICFLCYYWISYSTTSVLEKRKKKDKPKSCYVQ